VEALLATSMTVAFISSMAVAASPVRLRCSSEPRLDCSIWAESSSEAEATWSLTVLAAVAASAIFWFWASIFFCWARISVSSNHTARTPRRLPSRSLMGVLVTLKTLATFLAVVYSTSESRRRFSRRALRVRVSRDSSP